MAQGDTSGVTREPDGDAGRAAPRVSHAPCRWGHAAPSAVSGGHETRPPRQGCRVGVVTGSESKGCASYTPLRSKSPLTGRWHL